MLHTTGQRPIKHQEHETEVKKKSGFKTIFTSSECKSCYYDPRLV